MSQSIIIVIFILLLLFASAAVCFIRKQKRGKKPGDDFEITEE